MPLNGMENYKMHAEGRGAAPDPTFNVVRQRIFLLHNQGDNTFVEEASDVGMVIGSLALGDDAGISESKNPVWFDLDNDGDQDLYIAGSPHFLFLNAGFGEDGAFRGFIDVTHTRIRSPNHDDKMVFSAAAADFDQDGQEDLFLGYWNGDGSHTVLRNKDGVLGAKDESGWAVGDVSVRRNRRQEDGKLNIQKTSHFKIGPKDVYENTMGMIVGDLNDDGFPDAYIGTGTPAWSEHDLLWLNMADASGGGWRGFARHVLAGGDKTHGHGATFADLDRNFHTDLLINPGGFALCDTLLVNSWSHSGYKCEARGEVGVCDSREMPVAFMRSSGRRDPDAQIILTKEQALVELRGIYSTHNPDKLQGVEKLLSEYAGDEMALVNAVRKKYGLSVLGQEVGEQGNGDEDESSAKMAAVLLRGTRSNRDAVGAHVELRTPGDALRKPRHYWVHSTNGFQSQNSPWINLPLGRSEEGELRVTWPLGRVSTATVKAWCATRLLCVRSRSLR